MAVFATIVPQGGNRNLRKGDLIASVSNRGLNTKTACADRPVLWVRWDRIQAVSSPDPVFLSFQAPVEFTLLGPEKGDSECHLP
jgi:hypothetical protein